MLQRSISKDKFKDQVLRNEEKLTIKGKQLCHTDPDGTVNLKKLLADCDDGHDELTMLMAEDLAFLKVNCPDWKP